MIITFTNNFIVMFKRSTPHGLHHQATVLGLHFYDGWVYADHNTFTDFYDDEYKLAGAISFKAMRSIRDHPFKTSAKFSQFLTPTPLPSAVFYYYLSANLANF